ncbi:hypothetical protein [Fibrella aquatilis]|uniref:Uncharacterized protein n=1 Tax=Fibrella aquatilis TaxID=2817059 RepID=A0A939GC71_9BACT|nr:hypothetical protein [Fibrella aquatilis]MBO0933917.1 hypothetical protein [Fibrella aquatilis]
MVLVIFLKRSLGDESKLEQFLSLSLESAPHLAEGDKILLPPNSETSLEEFIQTMSSPATHIVHSVHQIFGKLSNGVSGHAIGVQVSEIKPKQTGDFEIDIA